MGATGRHGRALAVAGVAVAMLAAAPGALADEPIALNLGGAAFWSGPSAGAACGQSCWEYELDVRDRGWRLRVGIDHATIGDVFTVELSDPGGSRAATFSPGQGLYSAEGFAEDPSPGRWRVRVTASGVTDLRYRMRAKLETAPVRPAVVTAVPPNLQALPPWDFTFSYPVTNGSTDGRPQGLPPAAGRTACHGEEVAEEGAVRCLRMAFGVRNVGQGPMQLHYSSGAQGADRILYQRLLYSDESYVDRVAGRARFHKTHGHYHHDEAIGLRLYRVTDPDRGGLEPAGEEHRKGFAHREELLREWRHFYPTWPEVTFGLGAGWGDYYEWDRPGNYIDLGLNPDGRYVLRMSVDPVDGILESNEVDNLSYSYIEIAGETVKLLETGRGSDPWDRCKILMPVGAEPDLPDLPLRPFDCPPDTTWVDEPLGLPAGGPPPPAPPAAGPAAKAKRKPAAKRCRKARRPKRRGRRARGSAGPTAAVARRKTARTKAGRRKAARRNAARRRAARRCRRVARRSARRRTARRRSSARSRASAAANRSPGLRGVPEDWAPFQPRG